MIKAACGKCNHRMSKETVVDFIYNGKFGFSFKPNMDRVAEDIDEFTDLSFPLSVNPAKNDSLNSKYVPLLSYPGAVFIIKNLDASSHVKKMIGDVLATWPIFLLNFFFTLISGALVWFLVSLRFFETSCDFGAISGLKVECRFPSSFIQVILCSLVPFIRTYPGKIYAEKDEYH